jgi:hypothetical protein
VDGVKAQDIRICWMSNDLTQVPAGTPLPGGCSYYRCYLPMYATKCDCALGYPAFISERGFGVKETDTTARFGFHIAVFKIVMERQFIKQIEIAKSLGQKIVADVDDFYEGLDKSNLAYSATDPEKNKGRNREHYQKIILSADLVTVTTPFLYEWYSQRHPNVMMIRNGVLPEQFYKKPVKNEKPVIGWVGAIPWRSNDIETLRDWLPDFLEEHDLKFHHSGVAAGAPLFHDIVGIPVERMSYSGMQPITDYSFMFPPIDIGIVPLSDIPFNHAKSTIKGLEYAASNIPFVAQGLPEYARLAEMGVGRVAHTPDDWRREMTALLDFKVRKREAAANYANMMRDHTIRSREPEWQEMVVRALQGHSVAMSSTNESTRDENTTLRAS